MTEWLQTASGRFFSLEAPAPDMIVLSDVAFALSNLVRYTGHVRAYSVAQHCLHVAERVEAAGHDRDVVLAALLHDAPEAFVGDVSSPLKRLLGDTYRTIEHRVARAVAERFDVDVALFKHEAVVEADMRMLATEAAQLLGPPPQPWGLPAFATPYPDLHITVMSAPQAEGAYLEALRELGAPL
jgi:hypothetical protein